MQDEMPELFASAGLIGILALLVGGAVLAFGIVLALRRSSRGAALAVLAAASLPWLLGGIGTTLGEMGAQNAIVVLGPAVTPKDLAAGNRQRLASHYLGTLGTILAVCGGALALARSGE